MKTVCSSLQAALAVVSPLELLRLGEPSRRGAGMEGARSAQVFRSVPLAKVATSCGSAVVGRDFRPPRCEMVDSGLAVRWECSRSWMLAETEGHVLFT